MGSAFTTDIVIAAPPAAVWSALARIGDIYQWNPGVRASRLTSERGEGLGACRHCDLGGGNYLDEEVVVWEPGARLTMRVTGTNLPFQRADIHFTLESVTSGTRVTVSPDYALKYGLVGKVLDRLFARARYRRGMETLLRGLKSHVERGGAG